MPEFLRIAFILIFLPFEFFATLYMVRMGVGAILVQGAPLIPLNWKTLLLTLGAFGLLITVNRGIVFPPSRVDFEDLNWIHKVYLMWRVIGLITALLGTWALFFNSVFAYDNENKWLNKHTPKWIGLFNVLVFFLYFGVLR